MPKPDTFCEVHHSLLTWPKSYFYLLWGIPLTVFLALWLWYKYQEEEFQKFNNLIEKRKSEIIALKLAGAPPFLWKPLLNCEGIHENLAPKGSCIVLSMKFWEKTSPLPENSKRETLSPPCLICHRDKNHHEVLFSSMIKFPPKPNLKNYMSFYATFFGGFVIFFLVTLRKRQKLQKKTWYLVGVNFFSFELKEFIFDFLTFLKKQKPRFYYLEKEHNSLLILLPPGDIEKWLRDLDSYLSKKVNVSASLVLQEMYMAHSLVIPYKEMRKIRQISLRLEPATLAFSEQIFAQLKNFTKNPEKVRKAIWKTKEGEESEFYLISSKAR